MEYLENIFQREYVPDKHSCVNLNFVIHVIGGCLCSYLFSIQK